MTQNYSAGDEGESGLLRLLAPNPSPMTNEGTNSYIVGTDDVAIIDPGPADAGHMAAIVDAVAGRRVRGILVTHAHLDHSPAAAPLAARLDAPVMAFGPADAGRSPTMQGLSNTIGGGEGVDAAFRPDVLMSSGDMLTGQGWTLRGHHTPGHMANHLSFEWPERRAVFTGDTVMDWASTLISPPDGDLGQFMRSLDLLERLDADRFLPGHGDPVLCPEARCRELRTHRLSREASILGCLDQPRTVENIVAAVYTEVPAALVQAAGRNVLAHLVHLNETDRARAVPSIAPGCRWVRR
ncbi:MBL fold metallo-hydrolase [Jannaschia sp. 2305UL9-9]|uniref:MBL fold metallo-hydrolase n=1 Tax=Jannaschia sp. 2305UL9-9 TaxID=3121638 RepID=UPI003528D4EC